MLLTYKGNNLVNYFILSENSKILRNTMFSHDMNHLENLKFLKVFKNLCIFEEHMSLFRKGSTAFMICKRVCENKRSWEWLKFNSTSKRKKKLMVNKRHKRGKGTTANSVFLFFIPEHIFLICKQFGFKWLCFLSRH